MGIWREEFNVVGEFTRGKGVNEESGKSSEGCDNVSIVGGGKWKFDILAIFKFVAFWTWFLFSVDYFIMLLCYYVIIIINMELIWLTFSLLFICLGVFPLSWSTVSFGGIVPIATISPRKYSWSYLADIWLPIVGIKSRGWSSVVMNWSIPR